MATNKLNTILNGSTPDLEAHLAAYTGSWPEEFSEADFNKEGTYYSVNLQNSLILSGITNVNAHVIKNGSGDILFCLTAEPTSKNFAAYFPQMIPFDPWGILDVNSLPFPNLPATKVNGIKWLYVYYSTNDEKKQKALLETLKGKLGTEFPFGADTNILLFDKLQDISQADDPIMESETYNGGLYYFGVINTLPFEEVFPTGAPWDLARNNITVRGCVFYKDIISNLSLQIPFFESSNPFGTGTPVKSISLVADITSPLLGIEPTETDLPLKQDRRIGLTGTVKLNNADFIVQGIWPVDGDDIIIRAGCKLSDINFDNSSFPVNLPQNINTQVEFEISKEQKSLNKISFDCGLDEWVIIDNIIKLQQVDFSVIILDPGPINLIMAEFEARAIIGSGDGIALICNGNYPTGDFYLGLDPATPIFLDKLAEVFLDSSPSGFEGIAITELSGAYNYNTKYISLLASIDSGLDTGGGHDFQFENVQIELSGFPGSYSCKLFTSFKVQNGSEVLDFMVAASYEDGWEFSAGYAGNLSLADAANAFEFSGVPKELNAFVFTGLDLYFSSNSSNKILSLSGSGTINIDDGETIDLFLSIERTTSAGKVSAVYTGSFEYKVGNITIGANAEFNDDGWLAHGGYAGDISLMDIGETFGFSRNIPNQFSNIEITGLDLDFNKIGEVKETFMSAVVKISRPTTTEETEETQPTEVNFFFNKISGDEGGYAFGLQTTLADLSDMPMVGEQLKDVKLSNIGFAYTSKEGEWDGQEFGSGLNMRGGISFSSEAMPFPLSISISSDSDGSDSSGGDGGSGGDSTNENGSGEPGNELTAAPTEPAEKWFKLGKKIGPLNVGALGFAYKEEDLTLLFRGDVSMAGLSIGLEGLGMSFNLTNLLQGKPELPEFSLNGLSLSYSKPPVEISGMFLKTSSDPLAFSGGAIIKAASFTISAIGAYTTIPDQTTGKSKPSLFIYGVFDKPIGGPSFFFVTGIAAGFGYNRRVRIPEITEIQEFPLVKLALNPGSDAGTTLTEVITSLTDPIEWILPSAGDYWLAVGIKFTSFKIIESFVLLIVSFGNRLQFDILGLSILEWPGKEVGTPVVYIELALKASFGPDSDVISIDAIITPNSYVFSTDAKLAGGFAFYTWVSGEHEGDFVLTLGGYHPRFKKPAHYPDVDRLSLNWSFPDFPLTIKGEMYFALTPTAIMAGGKWEVAYDLGFLRAYLIIWADMLIQWAPFHYDLAAGVRIGIEANIKILFIHISFKLEFGAELHIWGPPFAGELHVDWAIFSFTIPFGDHAESLPEALSWKKFELAFIPQKPETETESESEIALQALDSEDLSLPLAIRLQEGVFKEYDYEGEKVFIVTPQDLVISIESCIPAITMNTKDGPNSSIDELSDDMKMSVSGMVKMEKYSSRNTQIGIKPMGESSLNSVLDCWVEKNKIVVKFNAICQAKGMADAMWGNEPQSNDDMESKILKKVLSGLHFHTIEPPENPQPISLNLSDIGFNDIEPPPHADLNIPIYGDTYTEEIPPIISEIIDKRNTVNTVLIDLGFDLITGDDLDFDVATIIKDTTSLYEDPYFVKIGNRIPSRQDA